MNAWPHRGAFAAFSKTRLQMPPPPPRGGGGVGTLGIDRAIRQLLGLVFV